MRTYSALLMVALLPACGLTERCSTEQSGPYAAPAREDVPLIAPATLQATLPKLDGWGSASPKTEIRKLGTQEISSVSIAFERKLTPAATDAAPSGTAATSAALAAPAGTAAPASTAAPSGAAALGTANPTATAAPSPPAVTPPDPSLQKVTISIVDGRYIADAYAPFAVLMHYRGEMNEPHKRSIQLAGHPGIEQWSPETASVTVLLLVGQRFVVTLQGQNLTPPEVKAWLNAIDLGLLGSWGKPTTPSPAATTPP